MVPDLTHFSPKPVRRVLSTRQDFSPEAKPRGLWVSVEGDDGWSDWCEAENFGIGKYVHTVHLRDAAQILHIPSVADLDSFHEKYKAAPTWRQTDYMYIDWAAVALVWQGVVIAPYLWERRLDGKARWYYGWDCASGCIWDSAAVAKIELLGERAAA